MEEHGYGQWVVEDHRAAFTNVRLPDPDRKSAQSPVRIRKSDLVRSIRDSSFKVPIPDGMLKQIGVIKSRTSYTRLSKRLHHGSTIIRT